MKEQKYECLEFNELKIGNYVTVLNWIGCSDGSYKGDVLEIKSLSDPYVICDNITSRNLECLEFDIRKVEFIPLVPGYVESVLAYNKRNDIENAKDGN